MSGCSSTTVIQGFPPGGNVWPFADGRNRHSLALMVQLNLVAVQKFGQR